MTRAHKPYETVKFRFDLRKFLYDHIINQAQFCQAIGIKPDYLQIRMVKGFSPVMVQRVQKAWPDTDVKKYLIHEQEGE